MNIQPEFSELVRAADRTCLDRFGDRLAVSIVAGSVALGGALPRVSDLDWFTFLHDEPTAADKAWCSRTQRRLEGQFPVVSEVHLNLYSTERLRAEGFWRFIFRYGGTRVRGRNLIAEFAREGIRTIRPSRALAKSRVPLVRRCMVDVLEGRCPPVLAELPADPFLASRKLVRNFVIVEGAYVLMSRKTFCSFRQEDVLRGLRQMTRRCHTWLEKTDAILDNPHRAGIRQEDLMDELQGFVAWSTSFIEKA